MEDSGKMDEVVNDMYNKCLLEIQCGTMFDYIRLLDTRIQRMQGSDSAEVRKMNFGMAIMALKAGFPIRRSGWNGKGLMVFKQVPAHIESDVIPKMQSLPQSAKDLIIKAKVSLTIRVNALFTTRTPGVLIHGFRLSVMCLPMIGKLFFPNIRIRRYRCGWKSSICLDSPYHNLLCVGSFYCMICPRNKGVLKILNLKFIKCMKIKSANIRAEKLIITDSSTKEDYKKVLSLNVGDVFKVEGDYETCLARIEEVRAETEGSPETFGVCPITPGTSLFTVYGPQHLIVTDKM